MRQRFCIFQSYNLYSQIGIVHPKIRRFSKKHESGVRFLQKNTTTTSPKTAILRNILRVLLPLVIILVAGRTYVFLKESKPVVPQQPKTEKVWAVQAADVKISDYQPTMKLYGEAVSGRKVEIRSLVAGEIIRTGKNLRDGSIIKKGDILLQVDPFKYRGALTDAESRLAEAKARLEEINATIKQEKSTLAYLQEQLALAETDLQRAIQLSKKGTVSKKLEDDRRVVVSQRKQNTTQRKNALEVQNSRKTQQEAIIKRLEWGVKEAKRNLKDTTLLSPFDAYVSQVNAEVGRYVSANDRIATLLDKNRIDARFTLSDSQYGRIISSDEPVIGRKVTVNWKVSEPPLSYQAVIERVNSQISSDTGGIEVFANITNPLKGAAVRAGTFLEILVPDKTYNQVAKLPETSLFEGKYVYAIIDGRLTKREVKIIGASENNIIVTGNIKAGEKVLTTRISTVGEGIRVRIQNVSSITSEPADKTAANHNKKIKNLAQKDPGNAR